LESGQAAISLLGFPTRLWERRLTILFRRMTNSQGLITKAIPHEMKTFDTNYHEFLKGGCS